MNNIFKNLVFGLLVLSSLHVSAATIDNNAPVVLLRSSCGTGATELNNCFTTMDSLLTWVWNTRKPTAVLPLHIEVGPGSFTRFYCTGDGVNPKGFVAIRGTGPDTTKITSYSGGIDAAVTSSSCTNLTFDNIGILRSGGAPSYAIHWTGGGNSTWNNVLVENVSAQLSFPRVHAWYDSGCNNTPGKHYWFSSKLKVLARKGAWTSVYAQQCSNSESWIYASELEAIADSGTTFNVYGLAGIENAAGMIQMFGSAIRVRVDETRPSNVQFSVFSGVMPQIYSSTSGDFHMHGGIIGVNAGASSAAFDISAVSTTGAVHAHETAYSLKLPAGGGTATRVPSGSEAPFLWEPRTAPPNIATNVGADMYVETDCGANGDCNGGGNETHLMIYNNLQCASPASPWFDTITRRCRNVIQ